MRSIRRGRVAVVVWAVVATLARGAAGQPPDGEVLLRRLSTQAEALRGARGDPAVVSRIEQHLGVLERARQAALGGRVSVEYREGLLADAVLLERAIAMLRSGDRELALAAAADAEADLAIKRSHVEAGVGFAGEGLRTVRVTVRTMRGTQEERGHFVWFVARAWIDDQRRYVRFDEMSSPTTAPLAPGNYIMWLDEAGSRQPIVVGGHGRSQQTVDLALP